MATLSKTMRLAGLPPVSDTSRLPEIQAHLRQHPHKLVVLDDDPTGTQTVHDVPVLTTWTVDALRAEFTAPGNMFYILTNSRSLPAPQAEALNIEIGHNLVAAGGDMPFCVVSRSDSTLRGHFPLEMHALTASLGRAFDGWLIVPFFEEGGRLTINGVHYVADHDSLIPASATPFARDSSFGYSTSVMSAWVEEKTGGQVRAGDVQVITLDDIRSGGPDAVLARLMSLVEGRVCVSDAVSYRDLEVLVVALLRAEAQGRSFLYRTAASFVRTRAGLDARPLLTSSDLSIDRSVGGLVVVGSYVPRTTAQLRCLLRDTSIVSLDLSVDTLLSSEWEATLAHIAQQIDDHLRRGETTVIYTSRDLVSGSDAQQSLLIGQRVSRGIIALLNALTQRPAFIVAKGGITSSDIATQALKAKRAVVRGQITPGVPVWELDSDSRYPDLPYIVFPGTVGDDGTLATVVHELTTAAELPK